MQTTNQTIAYDQMKSLWEKHTLQAADPDVDFFESGGDSLSAVNLIVDIQQILHVDISLEQFMRNPSLTFLYDLLTDKKTCE